MSTLWISNNLLTSTGSKKNLSPLMETAVLCVGKLAFLRIQILEEI